MNEETSVRAEVVMEEEEEEEDEVAVVDVEQVVLVAADEGEGTVVSLRTLATMLQQGRLAGDSKVFVPPTDPADAPCVPAWGPLPY